MHLRKKSSKKKNKMNFLQKEIEGSGPSPVSPALFYKLQPLRVYRLILAVKEKM